MKELDRVISWLNKNSDKIFIVAGKLGLLIGVIALVIWLIITGIQSLSSVSGFQFDPFMLTAVIILGTTFILQIRKMNTQIDQIKELQQQVITKERSLVLKEDKPKKRPQ